MLFKRFSSTTLRKPLKRLNTSFKTSRKQNNDSPARTRFAPSPTGFLHLGSLRTALYNYLLAKSTGGQFLLRLEDTDQKRLVKGAEQNIYDSLKWCGIQWDEGPLINGPYGPYRQSDRSQIYSKYASTILDSGNAYRCFCSKERLDSLRESARNLQPPTTVTYDRNCSHISHEESKKRAANGESHTIRFKSPNKYPVFEDILHGKLDLQPQVNKDDVRYDDIVLVKSDGLPTYHFANVVDDHLMKITHVIRGEEWIPSTPKHIALYDAFGWTAPSFVHIPLLTSAKDKKLSKRSGDIDVTKFKANGILPEALINFVALFGWSPKNIKESTNSEALSLKELASLFNLNDLTKGNAKVDDKKLYFLNKLYLNRRIENDDEVIVLDALEILSPKYPDLTKEFVLKLLKTVAHTLTSIHDIQNYDYLITPIDFTTEISKEFIKQTDSTQSINILNGFQNLHSTEEIDKIISTLTNEDSNLSKKDIFPVLRFALSGNVPGLKIPLLIEFIGIEETQRRFSAAIKALKGE